MMVLGMLTANVLGLPMALGTERLWPILISLQGIPVVIMCICLPFCPDSPRQLYLVKGDKEGARRALVWFRGTTDVQDEMDQMQRELVLEETKGAGADRQHVSLIGIFRDRYLRQVFWLCAVTMFANRASGKFLGIGGDGF